MTREVPRKGLLIVLEGVDGAGKTTQVDAIEKWLRHNGLSVIRSREPTDGTYGQRLRRSKIEGRLSPEEELELFLDDRREHVQTLIAPGLARGAVVLLDRYYYSTVAYQGARGFDPEALIAVNEEFAPRPDLLLILDVDPEHGLIRVQARSDQPPDAFEVADKLRQSRAIFLDIAKRLDVARIVDADRPVKHVTTDILGHVSALIEKRFTDHAALRPISSLSPSP